MNDIVNKGAILSQAAGTAASSEATAIEQSRAIAQVQGALVVAQQRPRDLASALQRMRETCNIEGLAKRAFFKYPRGGSSVTGKTIHLATELARCWGNIDFGIVELRRDDRKSQSEMLAVTWDLETNMRVSNSFIVPHKRDKRGGAEVLTELRDIYENNANMGARRLRECIFRVLPPWFTEEAEQICNKTLAHGGGVPLIQRIANCLAAFGEIGVSREQIERKIGCPADKMTAIDEGNLQITYGSIQRNEITKEEEFEPAHASDITKTLKDASGEPQSGTADSPAGEKAAPSNGATPLEAARTAARLGAKAFEKWWNGPGKTQDSRAAVKPHMDEMKAIAAKADAAEKADAAQEEENPFGLPPEDGATANGTTAEPGATSEGEAAKTPERPFLAEDGRAILYDGAGQELSRYERAGNFFKAVKAQIPKEDDPRAFVESNAAAANHFVSKDKAMMGTWNECNQAAADAEAALDNMG